MNFNDALNTKTSDIEAPPLMPVGTYRAQVLKIPSIETVSEGKWEVCEFQLLMIEPQDDVDTEALSAPPPKGYGGLGKHSVLRKVFMFPTGDTAEDEASKARSMFGLKRFLVDHLAIEETPTTTLKELLNNSVGQQCLAFIQWKPDKTDPEIIRNEIRKTAPIV